MNTKKSKFLLIELLVLLIILSISAVNATENITADNTAQDTMKVQTNDLIKHENIKSTDSVNKNNTVKTQDNKKINTNITTKTTKKDNTVSSYTELYDKIEEIKTTQTSPEVVINLNPGDYRITQTINWGNITQNTKTLTINGNKITLDGQYKHQFMTINKEYTLNLENIIFNKCNATNGGVISNSGNLNIINSNFTHNTATYNGGVINNDNYGMVNITNSNFTNNSAENGGVIHDNYGMVNIINSNFTENKATFNGGVINNWDNLNITNSSFTNNSAENGGVIHNYNGNINITNSKFTRNNAKLGGAIKNTKSIASMPCNLSINNTDFYDNIANLNNVIYSSKDFTMKNSNIINNMGEIKFKSTNTFISPIVNEESSKSVTIKIEDKTYKVQKDKTGFIKLTQIINSLGEVPVIIEYPNFENNTIKLVYNVIKADIQNITLPTQTIKIGTKTKIETTINDTNTNKLVGEIPVTIKVNKQTYNATIKDGILNTTVNTSKLGANTYDIIINIPETTYYTQSMLRGKLNINKLSIANVTLPDAYITSMNNETLHIIVNDTEGKPIAGNIPVCVKLNGKTQFTTRTNNEILDITIPTDKLTNPTYKLTIIIGSNNVYERGIITQTINIQKRNTIIQMTTNKPKTLENLIANITIREADGKMVDGGFVIFKIGGKTLKYANGKDVRINVKNGKAQLNYTLTPSIGARNSNITVIYINSFYNRQNNTQNLTITQSSITSKTLTDIKVTPKTNTTLKIIVNDTNNKQIQGKTAVCIKINGKLFIKTNITNGIINVVLPTDTFKNPTYKITIILGENKLYTKATYNATLKLR